MIMSINLLRGTTFVFPDLACAIWYRDLDIIWSSLWKHIFTFTLISCTVKVAFWVVVATASVTWVDMCIHVFASSELGSNRARVSRRACICCVSKYTRVGCTGSPGRHLIVHVHSRCTRYALNARYHDYMSWSPSRRNSYRRLARGTHLRFGSRCIVGNVAYMCSAANPITRNVVLVLFSDRVIMRSSPNIEGERIKPVKG